LPSDEALRQNVSDVCREYSLDEEKFLEAARDIKIKSYENIMSAAKIFEACISYIILNDMLEGVDASERRKVLVIADRREAIKTACALAQQGDVILVAGKGHENYQIIKGVKHHFDDKEEIQLAINN
jgi:hypothetical protein